MLQGSPASKCAKAIEVNEVSVLLPCALADVAVADPKLVMVEWLDSRRGEGWVRLDELESTLTKCRSVGWIIAQDKESLTLAGHLGDNPAQCCGDLTIPKRAINKTTALTLKRKA